VQSDVGPSERSGEAGDAGRRRGTTGTGPTKLALLVVGTIRTAVWGTRHIPHLPTPHLLPTAAWPHPTPLPTALGGFGPLPVGGGSIPERIATDDGAATDDQVRQQSAPKPQGPSALGSTAPTELVEVDLGGQTHRRRQAKRNHCC
jgi:hypothetical protein